MRQRTRLLVTLVATVAVAAGAAAYAYYGVFVAEREETAKQEAEAKLVALDRDAMTKLLVTAKGETTTLEKRDGVWKLTAPVAAAADDYAVNSLLDRLLEAKRKGKVKEGADPAKFGLASPAIRVVATTPAGEAELALGDTNEFDGSLFVRAGAGPIATVEGGLRYSLEKTAFDLREKRPWTFDETKVRRVRVEGAEHAWAAERDGGGWKLVTPVAERADGAAVDRILNELRSLRAAAIPAEAGADGAPFGLVAPKATVTLELEGGGTLRLALGEAGEGEAKKVYARAGEGFVAAVPVKTLADVVPELFALRDKTVLPFDREAVARLEFEGTEAFAVERKREGQPPEETFRLVAPRTAPAKRWKASGALLALANLKAAAWIEDGAKEKARYGLAAPRRTVTVKDAAGKELARLLVGSLDGERYHVMAAGSPRVALVDKTRIDELPGRIADVEDLPVPPPAEGKAEPAGAEEPPGPGGAHGRGNARGD